MEREIIQLFIDYPIDMTSHVWDAINKITDEQFLTNEAYLRGSIRNFMVHLASTDRCWLSWLKNQENVGHLTLEDHSTRALARKTFESSAQDLAKCVSALTTKTLHNPTDKIEQPQWQILLQIIHHGTDHRATILQQLNEFGVKTFPQDFVIWLLEKIDNTPKS